MKYVFFFLLQAICSSLILSHRKQKQELLEKNKRIYLGFRDGHFALGLRKIFFRIGAVIFAPPLPIRWLFGSHFLARRLRPVVFLLVGQRVAHFLLRVLHT